MKKLKKTLENRNQTEPIDGIHLHDEDFADHTLRFQEHLREMSQSILDHAEKLGDLPAFPLQPPPSPQPIAYSLPFILYSLPSHPTGLQPPAYSL